MTKKTVSQKNLENIPKPAVATGIQIGILGCNSPSYDVSHRSFIDSLKSAIEIRGGKPHFFGLSGSSDLLNGNGPGLIYPSSHYRLPARDLIADQIELLMHEEHLGGLVMAPWSINSLVGMLMALARLNVPAIFLPNYAAWAQSLKSQEVLYSQISMLLLVEVLGLARMGSLEKFFVEEKKLEAGLAFQEDSLKWSGLKIMEMAEQKVSSRRFFSQSAFNNCMAIDCALGACPESVLHLSAVAQEAGVPFSLSVLNGIVKNVSVLASLNSQGEYPLNEFGDSGGVLALLGACAQFLQPSLTVGGKNLTDLAKAASSMRSGFKLNSSSKKLSPLCVLFGNLARDGALCRTVALKDSFLIGSGPVKVFNSEKSCSEAVLSKKIKKGDRVVLRYCGPRGSPGMPALNDLKNALEKKGLENEIILFTDGRIPMNGKLPFISHISPEASAGSALSILQDGDVVQWNLAEHTLTARLTETEIRVRLSRWKEQDKPKRNSYLGRYSKYSSSSAYGATLV